MASLRRSVPRGAVLMSTAAAAKPVLRGGNFNKVLAGGVSVGVIAYTLSQSSAAADSKSTDWNAVKAEVLKIFESNGKVMCAA